MLSIKQHGHWERYVPEKVPERLRLNTSVMFCRRQEDGMDWYEFLYGDDKVLKPDTIKMTVNRMGNRWIIQAVYQDATMLFPQNCILLEVDGITDKDPQKAYGQHEFFPDENRIGGPAPPPPMVTPPYVSNLLSRIETLEAEIAELRK